VRILVAGVGNIFLGDDGFGCAVAAALRDLVVVEVRDFGIRGFDLALALTAGIDAAVQVDACPRGGAPGTLYVLEPTVDDRPAALDSHALDPVAVLRLARSLGEPPRALWLVGGEPQHLEGELSAVVAAQIDPAATLVRELVEQLRCTS
jgi:hydrogenase maturation protease